MNIIEKEYRVCVECFTYNHAPFITDSMNGITSQKTSFPFVCTIFDDFSSDGAPEVINGYLEEHFQKPYRTEDTDDYRLICANHKTNSYCTFFVYFLKYNHYSIGKVPNISYKNEWRDKVDYIALCEGDDYWIDPLKLQKQVNFMDSNIDYGMVCSASKIYVQGMGMKKGVFGHAYLGMENLLVGNHIFNATVLKRRELEDRYVLEIGNHSNWKMGDWPRILHCAIVSRIGYIDDPMAVYRVLPNSASHTDSFGKFKSFNENSVAVSKFFIEKYGLDSKVLFPLLNNWLNKRLLMKACSIGDVELVKKYRMSNVTGLSMKEKISVFLSSNHLTNTLIGWYRTLRVSLSKYFSR